eukprot:3169122-Amphidinium_carterae.1
MYVAYLHLEVPRRGRRVEGSVDDFMADVPVAPPEEDVLVPEDGGADLHELGAAELLPREWSLLDERESWCFW